MRVSLIVSVETVAGFVAALSAVSSSRGAGSAAQA
jgi:hypothetical protein